MPLGVIKLSCKRCDQFIINQKFLGSESTFFLSLAQDCVIAEIFQLITLKETFSNKYTRKKDSLSYSIKLIRFFSSNPFIDFYAVGNLIAKYIIISLKVSTCLNRKTSLVLSPEPKV